MSRRLAALTPGQVRALTLPTEPYLSCEDCFDLVDSYVEAVLAGRPDAPPGLEEHLAGCAACAQEADSLLELVRDPAATEAP
jgi:hypothetical protein